MIPLSLCKLIASRPSLRSRGLAKQIPGAHPVSVFEKQLTARNFRSLLPGEGSANQSITVRLQVLVSANAQVVMKEDLGDESPSRLYLLEKRVEELEKRVISLANAFSLARHGSRRIRPPLWTFEQYAPRARDIPPGYRETARGGSAPRVAIVTPSLNYARYLRPAIDSVLSQGYSDLAYHVQDGGSSDGTREILAACDGVSWTSAPDTGQAQAINRGILDAREFRDNGLSQQRRRTAAGYACVCRT